MRFRDRADAGEKLAEALEQYRGQPAVVYALPRGGVVIGAIVAKRLGLPLDLTIPRKVGYPASPETAMCAVAESGYRLCNELAQTVDAATLRRLVEEEIAEAKRRRELYLDNKPRPSVAGKTAIVVDDGIATGLTMRVALHELKQRQPAQVVVAVPVAPSDVVEQIRQKINEVVALQSIPSPYFGAVGAYYEKFDQVTDAEVIQFLRNT